jgi:cytochrome c peroxidase
LARLKQLLFVGALLASQLIGADNKTYDWQRPLGFPLPVVPSDNPMSTAKVELGRQLFFDNRLSYNQTYSCATCHQPKRAFTDGLARAIGSTGQNHSRSTMSLTNVAYNLSFGWADNLTHHLEQQVLIPLLTTSPIELGALGFEAEILQRFLEDKVSLSLFAEAFDLDASHLGKLLSIDHIQKALATYQRTLISGNSPYDDWLFNDNRAALTASAKKGMSLFFSKKFACGDCHSGLNFSGDFNFAKPNDNLESTLEGTLEGKQKKPKPLFLNNGLYKNYPDKGLYKISGLESDMGLFKVPTLRNITLTAPYMHDGKLKNLKEVIEHYARAGSGHVNQDKLIKGFLISPAEQANLIAFLHSLTDTPSGK